MRCFSFALLGSAFLLACQTVPATAELATSVPSSPASGQPPVVIDDQIEAPPYAPRTLAKGTLHLTGSRTMAQLAVVWTDGFRHLHPDVKAEFSFKGSETAIASLDQKTSPVGLMSRGLTDADRKAFEEKHPTFKLAEVDVAFGAIAVIVPPENPVQSLSLAQLEVLFGDHEQAAHLTWGQLGLGGDWDARPVHRYVPDEKSGTRGQFAASVLGANGRLAAPAAAHGWHQQIVQDVAKDAGAVGVVSWANAHSSSIRVVPIASALGGRAVDLSAEMIASGDYPLVRPLSVVVALEDGEIADPLVAEFLRYILSENGQSDVIKDGFQPLGRARLLEQYDRLGWHQAK